MEWASREWAAHEAQIEEAQDRLLQLEMSEDAAVDVLQMAQDSQMVQDARAFEDALEADQNGEVNEACAAVKAVCLGCRLLLSVCVESCCMSAVIAELCCEQGLVFGAAVPAMSSCKFSCCLLVARFNSLVLVACTYSKVGTMPPLSDLHIL